MTFENKQTITSKEFKAWLAGYISARKDTEQIDISELETIHDMALKIEEEIETVAIPIPRYPTYPYEPIRKQDPICPPWPNHPIITCEYPNTNTNTNINKYNTDNNITTSN